MRTLKTVMTQTRMAKSRVFTKFRVEVSIDSAAETTSLLGLSIRVIIQSKFISPCILEHHF